MAGGSSYNSVSANGSSQLHAGHVYNDQQQSYSAPQQTYSVLQQYQSPQQSGNSAQQTYSPPQNYNATQNNYSGPQQDHEAPQHNYNAPQHNGQVFHAPQHTGNVYHGPQHTGNVYNNTNTSNYMQDPNNPLVAIMSAQAGNKSTVLHKACAKGDENQVRALLDSGENIEAQDADFLTPLQVAVKKKQLSVAALLINHKANVDAHYKFWSGSEPPVLLAIMSKNEAMVRLLVENGADFEVKSIKGCGLTPIGVAAKEGMESTVSLLLDKGADIEVADTFGATALYWATAKGYEAMVRLLVEKGADIEVSSTQNQGLTPLGVAAREGYENIVSILLEKNPNLEAADALRATPLYWATQHGYEGIIVKLVQAGASPDFKVRAGMGLEHLLFTKPHIARLFEQARRQKAS